MTNNEYKSLEERAGRADVPKVDVQELVGRIAWDAAARYGDSDPERVGRIAWSAAAYGNALERLQAVSVRLRVNTERVRQEQEQYRQEELQRQCQEQAWSRYESLYKRAERPNEIGLFSTTALTASAVIGTALNGHLSDGNIDVPGRWLAVGIAAIVSGVVGYCSHRWIKPKVDVAYQEYQASGGKKPPVNGVLF